MAVQQQQHGYATHTNMLGGLKPVKGATEKVGLSVFRKMSINVLAEDRLNAFPCYYCSARESLVDLVPAKVAPVEEVITARSLALVVVPVSASRVVKLH